MNINRLRSLIREIIEDFYLNEDYSIEPTEDQPFFSQKGFNYKIFNILEDNKKLGKIEAKIPISLENGGSEDNSTATIEIKFNSRLLLDANKHSKIVNSFMPDLVEFIEDDIVSNKSILDIEFKGLRSPSEKTSIEKLLEIGGIKIINTISLPDGVRFIIGEPGVFSDESERYTDEFGKIRYRDKNRPKEKYQNKPLTKLRTRKKKD